MLVGPLGYGQDRIWGQSLAPGAFDLEGAVVVLCQVRVIDRDCQG